MTDERTYDSQLPASVEIMYDDTEPDFILLRSQVAGELAPLVAHRLADKLCGYMGLPRGRIRPGSIRSAATYWLQGQRPRKPSAPVQLDVIIFVAPDPDYGFDFDVDTTERLRDDMGLVVFDSLYVLSRQLNYYASADIRTVRITVRFGMEYTVEVDVTGVVLGNGIRGREYPVGYLFPGIQPSSAPASE